MDIEAEWGFREENPYPAEVVLIDESSMLDLHLLYRVLISTAKDARLVFVGDANQLPSVGPGNVLRDLIASGTFPVTDLREIFRQKDTSAIVYAAHAINEGEVPDYESSKDFMLCQSGDENKVQQIILKLAEQLYAKRDNFQILSPRHSGILGVTVLNEKLRELINPPRPGLQEVRLGTSDIIREEDRIMIVKNDYDLSVFNGDVGKISRVDQKARTVEVKIFGDPVQYVQIPYKNISSRLRLAFATTIHKTQGLEFDTIVMPLVGSFRHQLQRNLLYTAVTRARKRVILVGTHSALLSAVMNDREDLRNTLLKERLCLE